MAVLPIRNFPDPTLKQKAKRVRTIDRSVKKLISDMIETLNADSGRAGLAAPQLGFPFRIIVVRIPEKEARAIINPKIARKKGERWVHEGCLSVNDFFRTIKRAESVTVKGRDQNGKEIRIKAEGLLAQALEHEIDHINGVLYLDHLESTDKLYKIEPEETQL